MEATAVMTMNSRSHQHLKEAKRVSSLEPWVGPWLCCCWFSPLGIQNFVRLNFCGFKPTKVVVTCQGSARKPVGSLWLYWGKFSGDLVLLPWAFCPLTLLRTACPFIKTVASEGEESWSQQSTFHRVLDDVMWCSFTVLGRILSGEQLVLDHPISQGK